MSVHEVVEKEALYAKQKLERPKQGKKVREEGSEGGRE